MNIRKWKEVTLPPSVWVTKMTEELGEVADIVATDPEVTTEARRKHLLTELDQLIFIGQQFKRQIRKKKK